MRRRTGSAGRAVVLGLLVAACSGPILANPTLPPAVVATPSPAASRAPDPQPIVFPRDDAAHDRLTEWWYYTGHLADASGHRWGFEFVIFRAERGGFPVTWASHVALTDETAGTFAYAQRSQIGPQVDRSSVDGTAFSFVLPDPSAPVYAGPTPQGSAVIGSNVPTWWAMRGESGSADLGASLDGGTSGFQLRTTVAPGAAPVLHQGNGWVDFGPAGGSYYYSRPRLAVVGSLLADGLPRAVSGEAWFDHQWGDFISVGGGGWDWFAVNLANGTDLTISRVRAADGTYPLVYGTLVSRSGSVQHLAAGDFTVTATGSWTSPHSGATYPAGWRIMVPRPSASTGCDLTIDLTPTVADQELDTRASTGVVYWEGSQRVTVVPCGEGDQLGGTLGGEAYVELTGYAPAKP